MTETETRYNAPVILALVCAGLLATSAVVIAVFLAVTS
jgi:hypothetical protein